MDIKIYFLLLQKEIRELILTQKGIAFIAILAFFSAVSPISAFFMPEIMKSISETQNLQIILPEPTWLDSIQQYIKNITQICTFIAIIIFMGFISKEKESGTLVFLFVKPVKRDLYILSKYTAITIFVSISAIINTVVVYLLTYYLFGYLNFITIINLNFFIWVYLMIIMHSVVFFSSLFKSQIISGVSSFGFYLLFSLAGGFFSFSEYLPVGVLDQASVVLQNGSINFWPVLSSFVLIISFVVLSIFLINKWEAK
jgi:ABC-2 type transport system permease protein